MKIKQLTVFLENKTGRLKEMAQALGKAGINITAFSMAENAEFGILRMIVSEPDKALQILKEEHFTVNLTDVICLGCSDVPSSLAKALGILSENGVEIEYMYAFSSGGGTASIILRPGDVDKAIEVLQTHKLELIASDFFYKL